MNPVDFLRRLPPVVRGLMAGSTVVFLLQFLLVRSPLIDKFYDVFSLVPSHFLGGFWLWQGVTYIFFHFPTFWGSFFYLMFMYILYSQGERLENQWGSWAFLKYLLVCAVTAALASSLYQFGSPRPIVNPEPVYYALLVAMAFAYPDAEIRFFFAPMKIWSLVIFLVIFEFLARFWKGENPAVGLGNLAAVAAAWVYLKSFSWRWSFARRFGEWIEKFKKPKSSLKSSSPVRFHELSREVDRILDKISEKGMSSLTDEEEELMRRYSQSKTPPKK